MISCCKARARRVADKWGKGDLLFEEERAQRRAMDARTPLLVVSWLDSKVGMYRKQVNLHDPMEERGAKSNLLQCRNVQLENRR